MSYVGPKILTRTMSMPTKKGSSGAALQYHSRSDNHSKVACWTLLFDLLSHCGPAKKLAESGRMGFGINHVMVGKINKTLDLVITILPSRRLPEGRASFVDLVQRYGIVLDEAELAALAGLPTVFVDSKNDVSEVAVAIEAKACMTEHGKSLPRLHAEILATGYLARMAAPQCITVSYNLVNAAASFKSPGKGGLINNHSQPGDARMVVDMLSSAIPLARQSRDIGYDVVGVTVIDCANDGSPVTVNSGYAAPKPSEHVNYERMMVALCGEFRRRYA